MRVVPPEHLHRCREVVGREAGVKPTQDLAYAAALRSAGVPTVLREYPDLVHGFFGMGAISASAKKAADELCRDLRNPVTESP